MRKIKVEELVEKPTFGKILKNTVVIFVSSAVVSGALTTGVLGGFRWRK